MIGSMRQSRGEIFTLTLMVNVDENGATAPFDIYVDRVPVGMENIAYRNVDGAVQINTSARLEPNEDEKFDIEIILEKDGSPMATRPHVRVSPDMTRMILEKSIVEELLEHLDDK